MGRVLAKRALVPHPIGPSPNISVGCKLSRFGSDALKLEYVVVGDTGKIRWPAAAVAEETEGLWNATCFELFLAQADGAYIEYNFAPSCAWANYRFDGYRDGMAPAFDLQPPEIFIERADQRFGLIAFVELPVGGIEAVRSVALSAVIEETDGTKSYWALAHPPGKPDFHHPACFAATLPAPEAP